MSKSKIIDSIATSLSQERAVATECYDSLIKVLRRCLEQSGGFEIVNFGAFKVEGSTPVTANDLQDQLSTECGLDTSGVLLLLNGIVEYLRTELPDSKQVDFEGLGVMEFFTEKPKIVKNATTHQNIIHPGEKQIVLKPEADLITTLKSETLVMESSEEFSDILKGLRLESVLVVLHDMDRFSEILDFHFSEDGWKTDVTDSVVDAVQRVRAGQTYLIVLDDQVKKYQDLIKFIKFHLETAMIPVIMTRPAEYEKGAQEEVEILCDEEVPQPFEVKRFLNLSDAELERSTEEQLLFLQELHFRIPSTDSAIDKCLEWIDELTLISGTNDEGRNALGNAFREAAGNAVRHGNAGQSELPVNITYLLDKEKITIIIRDEGKGFDWQSAVETAKSKSALEAARESREKGKLGGLGIKVMMQFLDKVEWNRDGAEIVLTKYRNN